MFANLYHTGEQSGKLDDTLHRLQMYYQEEGFRNLQIFTRILNGLLYAAVAGTVAYNVISFWTNYYGQIFNSM
jgi:type II secretory pathway component PulF